MTTLLTFFVTPAVAIYLVNLALASVLISLSGLLAVALSGRRTVPFRHAILVSTLLLSLIAPALTWFACQSNWGKLAISFDESKAVPPSPHADAALAKSPTVNRSPGTLPSNATLPPLPFALHRPQKSSHEDSRAVAIVPAVPHESASLPKETPVNPMTTKSWRLVAISLAAWVWLLGTLLGAGWIVRGFLVLRRFRRSLETSSLAELEQASHAAAIVFGIDRLPPIRVSARAPAPLSLGLLRPLIVLPKDLAEESDAEQLRAILVHEMAHLVHHHHWIGLAQWLAGILFWWNPLLHRVNRGILRLREEICDDHVLQSSADGRAFARMLVDLAARLSNLPRVPATLAILETGYSDFRHRIANLLDKERIIVTRMNRKAMFSVALFSLAILFAVPLAGLRAEQKSNAVKVADVVVETKAASATTPDIAKQSPPSTLRIMQVRVVGLDGRPMPGAKVHSSIVKLQPKFVANTDHVCDADGQTTIELPMTLDILRLFASSPHHVPLFMDWEQEWFDAKKPLPKEFVFKLEKGATIGGLVKNEDGKPVVGATVRAMCHSPRYEQPEAMGRRPIIGAGVGDVVTDTDGRWALDFVPEDQRFKVTINVNHPDYVSDFTWGQMQEAQKITSEELRQRTATIVMHKGTVVSGKVTDPQGKPLSGAVVAWGADPYSETTGDQMFHHEVYTDANGIYRLPPMPVDGTPAHGTDLRITVMAEGWSPDMKQISYTPKNAPVDFQLKSAKRLRLRFVDESGKPIPEVYVSIDHWRDTKSLYNTKHPIVLDTKIPEKADKNGIYEWTWAPEDKVAYIYGKPGYSHKSSVIAADGAEHEIRLVKSGPGSSVRGDVSESAEEERLDNDSNLMFTQGFALAFRLETVQKELQLTDQQKERLAALLPRPEPLQSPPTKEIAAIQKDYQRLQAILLPKQLERARQIAFQAEGAMAFSHPDVLKTLELTTDQRFEMDAIFHESMNAAWNESSGSQAEPSHLSKEQKRALMEKSFAVQKTVLDKSLKLFSREQRAKYEKMLGKKIDVDKLLQEIIDAVLKEDVAPAENGKPKKEIKDDKKGPAMQKNAAAPARASIPLEPIKAGASSPGISSVSENNLSSEEAAAMKTLRAHPPVAEKDRIAAAIILIRSRAADEAENGYPAENAMRELVRIGKPVVPRLVEELDRTDSNGLLRALGFVLRGIGDPRAVPALIRAISRLAQPIGSDYGITINNDPELLKFMSEHDHYKCSPFIDEGAEKASWRETTFAFGRPINEIMPALQKLTGENHRWFELAFVQMNESAEQNRLKRLEFQKLAVRWADWWEKNWPQYVKDEGDAQLEPTRRALAKIAEELAKLAPQPLMEIPCGKNVDLANGASFPSIVSFDDPRRSFRLMACIDLDTVRLPLPPQDLVKNPSPGTPSPDLLSWAEKEGVHLIGMKFKPQGGEKSYYALQPVGMKVWRIENSRYDNLAKELRTSEKFDLPGLWKGPIASVNEKTGLIDENHPASFLFITKRGICGAMRVRNSRPKAGAPASEVKSPLELQFIFRSDKSP